MCVCVWVCLGLLLLLAVEEQGAEEASPRAQPPALDGRSPSPTSSLNTRDHATTTTHNNNPQQQQQQQPTTNNNPQPTTNNNNPHTTTTYRWLNILGELTRFGDREFYKDWWNAATVGDYWKLWNMPVHKWLLRTVYL